MTKYHKSAYLVACAVPLLFMCWALYWQSIDFPFWDDFFVLKTVNDLKNPTNGFAEVIRLFFEQHMEHRIAFARLTFLLSDIVGLVDLRWQMVLAFVGILGLIVVFYKFLLRTGKPTIFIVPVFFIVLNLQYHQAIFFSMSAVSNVFIHVFAMVAFYCLVFRLKYNLLLIIGLSVLSIFTTGNGIILSLVLLLGLLIQKEYKKVFVYGGVVGLVILMYYSFNYTKPSWIPPVSETLKNPMMVIQNFFYFLGNTFSLPVTDMNVFLGYESFVNPQIYDSWIVLPVHLSVGIFIFVSFVIKIGLDIKNKALTNSSLFIGLSICFYFITALAVSCMRPDEAHTAMFLSRYKINGIVILVLLYFSLIDVFINRIQTQTLFITSLAVAVLFAINSNFIAANGVINYYKASLCDQYSYLNNKTLVYYPKGSDILKKANAMAANCFTEPTAKHFLASDSVFDFTLLTNPQDTSHIKLSQNQSYFNFDYLLPFNGSMVGVNGLYLRLKSKDKSYLLFMTAPRNSIINFLKTQHIWNSYYKTTIPKTNIDAGLYNISLFKIENTKNIILANIPQVQIR